MSDRRSSDVLGGLPNSRPHRRSQKRPARPAEGDPAPSKRTAASAGTKRSPAAKATQAAKAIPAAKVKPNSTDRAKPTSIGRAKPTSTVRAKPSSTAAPKPSGAAKRKTTRSSTPGEGARLPQPKQPTGSPAGARSRQPASESQSAGRHDLLGTAVQAAAELAEIGLTVGARALRGAVSRLPHP